MRPSQLSRKYLFSWVIVVPGGGIEPPTRGFSISLESQLEPLKLLQSVT